MAGYPYITHTRGMLEMLQKKYIKGNIVYDIIKQVLPRVNVANLHCADKYVWYTVSLQPINI